MDFPPLPGEKHVPKQLLELRRQDIGPSYLADCLGQIFDLTVNGMATCRLVRGVGADTLTRFRPNPLRHFLCKPR